MEDLTRFLKAEITPTQSEYVNEIANKFDYWEDQRSFALRLLIHYVGDIHQPLHTTAMVNSSWPSGDRGGNKQKIPKKKGVKNLHFLWDSVLYEWTGYSKLPLSSKDWDWFTEQAQSLAQTYPIDSDLVYPGDFEAWA